MDDQTAGVREIWKCCVHKRVQAHIAWLEKEPGATNTDLTRTIRETPAWREKEDLLRSVPGVGPVLATTLFANLPELGTLSRKEVAALAGVAPFPRDSGTWKGRRTIWDGPAHVRATLYMAAFATRKNPVIRAFYHSSPREAVKWPYTAQERTYHLPRLSRRSSLRLREVVDNKQLSWFETARLFRSRPAGSWESSGPGLAVSHSPPH